MTDNTTKVIFKEVYSKAVPLYVEIQCNDCTIGKLEGVQLVGQNDKGTHMVLHVCTNCNKEEIFEGQSFPTITHKKGNLIGNSEKLDIFLAPKANEVVPEYNKPKPKEEKLKSSSIIIP